MSTGTGSRTNFNARPKAIDYSANIRAQNAQRQNAMRAKAHMLINNASAGAGAVGMEPSVSSVGGGTVFAGGHGPASSYAGTRASTAGPGS